jgi:cation diffusion facilitator CzcD-associated flavoprotein CzcO
LRKAAIIGAGVAGLSAGCYARMNGYDAEIYESHSLPGGVCASWRRGEYLFDHCRHWVLGSGRGEASPCAWPAPAGWLRKYANTTGLNFAAQLDDPILDSNEQFLLIDRLVTYVHILEQTAQEE